MSNNQVFRPITGMMFPGRSFSIVNEGNLSNPNVELPPPQSRRAPYGAEALPPPDRTNRRLYMAVIVILGLVLMIGVAGWLLLAATGKAMPDGLGVILGAVAGGLVGLISDNSRN
jgi:hypothetical protein